MNTNNTFEFIRKNTLNKGSIDILKKNIFKKRLSDNDQIICIKSDDIIGEKYVESIVKNIEHFTTILKFSTNNELDKIYDLIENKIINEEYFEDLMTVFTKIIETRNTNQIFLILKCTISKNEKQLFIILAQFYKKEKNFNKMIEYYKKASELKSVKSMLIVGMYYLDNNNFIESEKYLDMALKNIPDNKENNNVMSYTLNCFGEYYEKTNNYEKMIEYYSNSAKYNNIKSIKKLAKLFYEKQDYNNSEKFLELLIQNNDYELIHELIVIYYKTHKYKEIVELLKIGDEKNIVFCTYYLGDFYYTKQFYNKAISKFKKIKLCGKYDIFAYIGKCYEQKYGIEKINNYLFLAKKYYICGIKNNSCKCLKNIGKIFMNEKNYEKCELYYNYGIKHNFENANYLLAKLFYIKGDTDKMIKCLQEGIEKFNNVECMYEMALYEEKNNNINKMIEYLEKSCDKYLLSALKLSFYYTNKKDENNQMKYLSLINNFKLPINDIIKLTIENLEFI
jgi:tetratricopeptide (TPR) repeat protein